MKPTRVSDREYTWEDLEVKESKDCGKGVFAASNLKKGTVIPIIGREYKEGDKKTHIYEFDKKYKDERLRGKIIDGRPSGNEYKDVANFGLSIAMMINEPTGRFVPNCVFKRDSVILTKDVKMGNELFIYYGDTYERVNYELNLNTKKAIVKRRVWEEFASFNNKDRNDITIKYMDVINKLCAHNEEEALEPILIEEEVSGTIRIDEVSSSESESDTY